MSARTMLIAALAAISSLCANAQDLTAPHSLVLPNAPSPATNVPPVTTAPLFLPVQSERPHVKGEGVGKEFIAWTVAANAATVVDFESTVYALDAHPNAYETSLFYGKHPTRGRMYGVGVPMNVGFECLSYYVKKKYGSAPDGWIWRIPLVALTLSHTGGAAANLSRFH